MKDKPSSVFRVFLSQSLRPRRKRGQAPIYKTKSDAISPAFRNTADRRQKGDAATSPSLKIGSGNGFVPLSPETLPVGLLKKSRSLVLVIKTE